ncbi:hypothetical protein DRO42_08790 [Candidatus Bathyarchaeota archaeon]|nr:MAG: hypothetical protein DRO42_08790 [Candidatus Bathyarchaeota archaeon]
MDDRERKKRPIVTYLLLASAALIQLYVSIVPTPEALRVYEAYSLFPVRLFDGVGVEALVTYIFLHGGWLHFFVNAIALWGAGSIVEREIGHVRYVLVYLSSGVAAGLAHSFLNMSSSIPLVGSSGAIFGVIAVLFLLMPFKITFALIVPLPAVLVGIMLSAVTFSAVWLSADGIVAHQSHLGGFIFGCLWAFTFDRRRALKGLIVAAMVFAILYYLGVHFSLV